jgi:ATP-dependent Clp protease ATP-binding subunit ClpA
LKSLHAALEKQGIKLSISDKAHKVLAQMGFTPQYGARPLGGVIRSQLRRPLSRKIISGEIGPGSLVEVDTDADGAITWKIG